MQPARRSGSNAQIFGKKEQVPDGGQSDYEPEPLQERASAMNNLEYVRKCMRIKRTPNVAGTKLTIEFTYYDNGFVSINGFPKGDYTRDEAERWLASTRFVMQMIEEFRNYINKSKTSAAA